MMRHGSLQGFSVISSAKRCVAALSFAAIVCIVMVPLLFSLSCGAAEGPMVPTGDDRALAQDLLNKTFDSYKDYTRAAFTSVISDDFANDKFAFVNRVERSFYKARPSQIDFFLNTVERTGDRLAVSFRWEKKAMLVARGAQRSSQGQCTLIYKEESGAWRLYDIKGKSPF